MRRRTLVFSALASAGLCAVPRVQASSGLAGDIATFSEQVAQTAALVTAAAETTAQVINNVQQGIENLKRIAAGELMSIFAPYLKIYNTFLALKTNLEKFQTSILDAKNLITGTLKDAQGRNLSLQKYLEYEFKYARERGDKYQARVDADFSIIENLKERAVQLQSMSARAVAITGNVQGLQLLNQQTSMVVGELMDLKTAVLQQNIAFNQNKVLEEAVLGEKAKVQAATALAAKARFDRNKSLKVTLPAPWNMSVVPNATSPAAPVPTP